MMVLAVVVAKVVKSRVVERGTQYPSDSSDQSVVAGSQQRANNGCDSDANGMMMASC